jgi:hypothetical protein
MTSIEIQQKAVLHALHGGRKFGTAEHGVAIGNIAEMMVAAIENGESPSPFVEAIKAIGNLSALQQKLGPDGAKLIDRNERGAARENIWANLRA